MRVLVACEFSGAVSGAFAGNGHDAWSCDLLPAEHTGKHIQGDMFEALKQHWDLVIAHPPCTYLCGSGLHWNKRRPGRSVLTEQAVAFVKRIIEETGEIPLAIENPVGCLSTRIGPPTQIIQPFEYGHPESKSTCLWLRGLPPLKPTNILPLPPCGHWENQTSSGQNKLAPSPDRWKLRAKTYVGIARAMADQWAPWVGQASDGWGGLHPPSD